MFGNTSQLLMSQELMRTHVCPEMHQCTLIVCELPLCLEVLYVSEWSTSFKLANPKTFTCKMPSATFTYY